MHKNNWFRHKKILLFIPLLLMIAGGVVVFYITHTPKTAKVTTPLQPSQTGPTPVQARQEAQTNAGTKEQLAEGGTGQKQPATSTTSKSITITTQKESNNSLTVFTKLIAYSSGSCTITITNSTTNKTVSQTANVIYQPEFSSCAGFSIPIDQLGSGVWHINLVITSNGTSDAKSIDVTV